MGAKYIRLSELRESVKAKNCFMVNDIFRLSNLNKEDLSCSY